MAPSNAGQIKAIQTLRTKLGLTEDEYRASLVPYGVSSCKDLTVVQAREYIDSLARIATGRGVWKKMRHSQRVARSRGDDYATQKQIGMLEHSWSLVSRATTAEARRIALNKFIFRRWGFGSVEMLPSDIVPRVKKAIDHMTRNTPGG